jgi:hypothetical protein
MTPVLKSRGGDWSLAGVDPLVGLPILEHVERLLAESGRGPLPHGGEPLPDEPPPDPAVIKFGAGSFDGIGGYREGPEEDQNPLVAAAAILDLVRSRRPNTAAVHLVAQRLAALRGPGAFDRLLDAVAAARSVPRTRLATLARWLCTHGVDRQQVKAGLTLLGASGAPEDRQLIKTLGLLEELTLYALVALTNLLPEAEQEIFELAQQVDGWGRIHAVRRLAKTTDPVIQRWLVRGGFANAVMDEEVAFIAATTGGLRTALAQDVDDELLDWVGRLLAALATGGPAQDMSDYDDGAAAISEYLVHMASASATLQRLHHLVVLERYLADSTAENPHLGAEQPSELSAQLSAVLARPEWRSLVADALSSEELTDVKSALSLVDRFDLDPVPVVRSWVPREPHDAYLWQTILARADAAMMADLVALAESILPFDAIQTGPAKDFGLGQAYRAEACLDQILQRLRKFPQQGWTAIEVGLRCRVTRTRNMALAALGEWPRDRWPDGAQEALTQLLFQEPDDKVRKRVRELLA